MSINSQVLETMENEGIINEDALDNPSLTAPSNLEVLTSYPSSALEPPLTRELKDKLLSPSTVYKSIQDGVETVSNMEELQEQIVQNNNISFADAEEVAMTFESFSKKVSLKEFTQSPSKTNLAFTKRYMDIEIQLRQEQVCTEAEAFFNGHLSEAEEALEDYKGFYGKNLLNHLEPFRNECTEWLSSAQNIADQLFPLEGDFVNIATIAVEQFPENFQGPGDIKGFKDAVQNLRILCKENVHVKNLLRTVKCKGGYEDFVDPGKTSASLIDSPSLKDLFEMFGDAYLPDFLIKLEQGATNGLDELQELQSEQEFNPTEFKQVRDFIVSNGQEIDEASATLHYYGEVLELVQKVFVNVHKALDYMKTEK